MKWEVIAERHPSQYVLVEAIRASSDNQRRHIEDMSLVEAYPNPRDAWDGYKQIHKLYPSREFYVFHTSRTDVTVVEEFFSGVRIPT